VAGVTLKDAMTMCLEERTAWREYMKAMETDE